MHQSQQIELDCAPGSVRPGDLLAWVTEGLGLPDKEPVSRVFGAWRWEYPEVPAAEWAKALPELKKRITALHHNGRIRFGSW